MIDNIMLAIGVTCGIYVIGFICGYVVCKIFDKKN